MDPVVYIVAYLMRAGIGLILIFAALIKFLSPIEDLENSILGYQILNGSIAKTFARILPWAEISIGVGLIANRSQDLFVVAAFGLLGVFSVSIGYALIRGIDTNCGCFKKTSPIRWSIVSRNLLLMGVLVLAHPFSKPASQSITGLVTSGKIGLSSFALIGSWLIFFGGYLLGRHLAQLRILGVKKPAIDGKNLGDQS